MVDMGEVTRQPMTVTIDEEARTRVRDAYVVSAPIAGRLMRVEVEPGDPVEGGQSVIARMLPTNPSALDIRTREQAMAAVAAAEAALRVALADLNKAIADKDFADLELERTRTLVEKKTVAQAALDRAERTWRAANATLDQAKAAISMREADLANSRAQLISFNDTRNSGIHGQAMSENAIPLIAPVSGTILQVMQKSETTLGAGTPILEIGDIANDLEIVTELLSTDAVKVSAGDRVVIDNWGGSYPLSGVVERVEPWGKLRTDPIIRMMVVSIGFYGMSTFEGPMMSIKSVNCAVALYRLDHWSRSLWCVGLNGMITFGALYYLTPKLWNRSSLYSLKLVSWHFWLATIGIVLYASSMWVTGIMEGLMWREVDANGFLVNAFADTVAAKHPMYVVRGTGGLMFLTGALIMCYNLGMTVKAQPAKASDNAFVPAE